MPLAAIIIATKDAPWSGAPLALAPWNDETLIEFTIAQLRAADVRDVEVVLGRGAAEIIPLISLDNVEPVVDARAAEDRASSVRAGAAAVPRGTEHAVLAFIDEPRPSWVYGRLIDAHVDAGAAITRPAYRDRTGAPLVVDATVLATLRNVADEDGLRRVIEGSPVNTVSIDDEVVVLRTDSAEAYARALATMET